MPPLFPELPKPHHPRLGGDTTANGTMRRPPLPPLRGPPPIHGRHAPAKRGLHAVTCEENCSIAVAPTGRCARLPNIRHLPRLLTANQLTESTTRPSLPVARSTPSYDSATYFLGEDALAVYSSSSKNLALQQQLQKSSQSASTTPQRPIGNSCNSWNHEKKPANTLPWLTQLPYADGSRPPYRNRTAIKPRSVMLAQGPWAEVQTAIKPQSAGL